MENYTGCVMAILETPPLFEKLYGIIDPQDLTDDGIETDMHVSIIYGLDNEVKTEDVRTALEEISIGQIRITNISLFENPKFDVLKMDVIPSKGLLLMRAMLEALPNEQTFPNFEPHVTIAYLKSGTGKKYITNKKFEYPIKVTDILYSYDDRKGQDLIYESIITGERKIIID